VQIGGYFACPDERPKQSVNGEAAFTTTAITH
jgi:hypothetical protein